MATKPFKVTSVIICDDIRREDNGKELLIGVYTGLILTAQAPPLVMAQLCVRIGFVADFLKSDFIIELRAPNGKNLITGTGEFIVERRGDPGVFSVPIPNVTLPSTGIYSIRFGLGSPPRKVGEFEVRRRTMRKSSARKQAKPVRRRTQSATTAPATP